MDTAEAQTDNWCEDFDRRLHQRVAVRIVRLFGQGRRTLVLGFMVATATKT